MLAPFPVIISHRRKHGHSISVENRRVKAATAAGHNPCGHENPERKEQRQSRQAWQETARLRKCTGQDVEGTEGALEEDKSREEECLAEHNARLGPDFQGVKPLLAHEAARRTAALYGASRPRPTVGPWHSLTPASPAAFQMTSQPFRINPRLCARDEKRLLALE